jgi:hypothetical protein
MVVGPLDEVARVVQQLAWFAAVFTLPTAHTMTISTAIFRKSEERGSFGFEIIPRTIDSTTLEDLSHPETTTCWHRLFLGTVLAYGFPISQRTTGKGAEIPFDLMAGLSSVHTAVQRDGGGTILAGHSLMLHLSDNLEDGVQWHCTELGDKDSAQTLPKAASSLDFVDLNKLSSCRTFLGYYQNAEVLLGTERLLRSNPIMSSGLEHASRRIELAREGTFTFGLSIKAIVNGSLGVKWSIPKTQQVSLEDNRDYFDLVDDFKDRQVILYDLANESAWLVSALSLALHITLTYLSQPFIQERHSIGGQPISNPWPRLPYASPSADGGAQARHTIVSPENHNLELWNDGGKPKKFCHVIESVLKDLTAIGKAVAAQKGDRGWRPPVFQGVGLRGWDFDDLATRKPGIIQKELPRDKRKVSWWNLEEADGMLVIFGRGFGKIIQPAAGTDTPFGSEGIPAGARLLVASRPCIQCLKVVKNGRHFLGQQAWKIPMTACELGHARCACSAIYHLERPTTKLFRPCMACASSTCNGQTCSIQNILAETGPEAFVFGETEYYHEVRGMERRLNRLANGQTNGSPGLDTQALLIRDNQASQIER